MHEVRSQLIAFTVFAGSTPDPNPRHDMLWWAGDMPATPDTYPLGAAIPLTDLTPLGFAVAGYIDKLVLAACTHVWAQEYLQKLRDCQFADLYTYLKIDVKKLDLPA